MMTLILERVAAGHFALGEIGTRRNERRFGATIEASGESWRLSRAAFGFGQTIVALDAADGSPKARYVPRGFLHLRGIYGGELRIGGRVLGWRANRQLGRRFSLTEGEEEIATFEAGSAAKPVRLELVVPDVFSRSSCCSAVTSSSRRSTPRRSESRRGPQPPRPAALVPSDPEVRRGRRQPPARQSAWI